MTSRSPPRTATRSPPARSPVRSGASTLRHPFAHRHSRNIRYSPAQLVDAGIPYVILGGYLIISLPFRSHPLTAHLPGHSERRTLFHETSEEVAAKTCAAISASLSVILCVGETLQEREAEKTKEVVEAQLKPVVAALSEADWRYVTCLLACRQDMNSYS